MNLLELVLWLGLEDFGEDVGLPLPGQHVAVECLGRKGVGIQILVGFIGKYEVIYVVASVLLSILRRDNNLEMLSLRLAPSSGPASTFPASAKNLCTSAIVLLIMVSF